MSGIIGLTSGCFDLIHIGHIRYLERCKSLCDKLIVGVDGNHLVARSKGKGRPIIDEKERLEMISSLSCVDSGFIVEEMRDFDKIVFQFSVDKLFKSEKFKAIGRIHGYHGTGVELVFVPDVPGLKSTTWIVEKIKGEKPRPEGFGGMQMSYDDM